MQVGGFPFIFFIAIDIQFVCPYQLSGMYQLELCEGRVLSGELSLISRRAWGLLLLFEWKMVKCIIN